MIDISAKLMLEIMDDRAGGGDRLRHLCAAESVQRFNFEMFAQGEGRLFRQKGITVVTERCGNLGELLLLLIANEKFRWRDTGQFVEERLSIFQLCHSKLARA